MSRSSKRRDPTTLGMWTVEHGGISTNFADKRDVLPSLQEITRKNPVGRVVVEEDVGGRSWLTRFLSGAAERELQMQFALEWSRETASLVFFDEDVSEHWAVAGEKPGNIDEATRRAISHGEHAPLSIERCMTLECALRAVAEYLKDGGRPPWLRYEFVG